MNNVQYASKWSKQEMWRERDTSYGKYGNIYRGTWKSSSEPVHKTNFLKWYTANYDEAL